MIRNIGLFLITVLFLQQSITGVGAVDNVSVSKIDIDTTALLITDPQNDFLKEGGAAYGLVKDNLKELNTIENIGALFKKAKAVGVAVFVSPHHYFSHDKGWLHRGALQKTINKIDIFRINGVHSYKGFTGSGADFLDRYKPYILDGKTVITSPHKVYGPASNDLILQLRKRGITKVIIGGMAANLCTESHMRELIENGFEVIMVEDAVGAPGEAAYQAALMNYGLIANQVVSTKEILAAF